MNELELLREALGVAGDLIAKTDQYLGINDAYSRHEAWKTRVEAFLASRTACAGWKLVPIEPTEAQLKAIDDYIGHWTGSRPHDREGNALAYKAMLDAAPEWVPAQCTKESGNG